MLAHRVPTHWNRLLRPLQDTPEAQALLAKVTEAAATVRQLKTDKAETPAIDAALKVLLAAKKEVRCAVSGD